MSLEVFENQNFGGVAYTCVPFIPDVSNPDGIIGVRLGHIPAGGRIVSEVIPIARDGKWSCEVSGFTGGGALTARILSSFDETEDGTPVGDPLFTGLTGNGLFLFEMPTGLFRRIELTETTGTASANVRLDLATNGVAVGPSGERGPAGVSPELRSYGGWLQWGDGGVWRNLVKWESVAGNATPVALRWGASKVQWKLETDSLWTDLVSLEEFFVYIQYSPNGTTLWHDALDADDLYIRFSTDNKNTWTNAVRFVGTPASVSVGSVTTLSPGASATVTNSGSPAAAVLNFGIPVGATGATGATGPQGPAGTGDVNGPATNSADYLPQWNGANSKTLKNGQPVSATPGNSRVPISDASGKLDGWVSAASTTVSGIVELETTAETVAGAGTTRATTGAGVKAAIDAMAFVGGSYTTSSWLPLPGGWIIQWLVTGWDPTGMSEPTTNLSYPIAFPNAVLGFQVTTELETATNAADLWYQAQGATLTGITVQRQGTGQGSNTTRTRARIFVIGR